MLSHEIMPMTSVSYTDKLILNDKNRVSSFELQMEKEFKNPLS